jgi:glycosyltransferase involved in cell wall biosynthesis
MLNFDRIVLLAAKIAGDRPILAAPYPLPSVVCRNLATEGLISGYLSDSHHGVEKRDPFVAGWWVNSGDGVWFLRRGKSHTILLLSARDEAEISGRMLLEARLKGYERILLVSSDGSVLQSIDVNSILLSRLCSSSAPSALGPSKYEQAFEEMYGLLGDRLRLPQRAFRPECVLIYTGSLQAGGAERQATYTALGLAKRWPGKVQLARNYDGGVSDFYKSALDAAKIPTYVTSDDEEYSSSGIVYIRNELSSRYLSLGFLDIFYMIFHQALLIQKLRPGLVHTFQDYSNVLAGIAADLVGVPRLVLSGRSLAPDNFGIFQPYMAPGYRALLKRRGVTFLNNSEAGANDYARWLDLPRSQFRVIRNGFEFPAHQAHLRSTQRQELGIPESAVLIGSITGFREEKRPELFLDMARMLRTTNPDVHFVVFGDGPLLESCREFVASQGLSACVHLPGLTDNAWRALCAMDIFVLTSRLEGLPNVMIEAQAMGVPVVCSGAGGMAETFIDGETGYSVPSGTSDAFAKTVDQLIKDKMLRARMGVAAKQYARQTFDIDRMVNSTIEAYAGAPNRKSDLIPDWQHVDSPNEIRIGGVLKEDGYCFVGELPMGADPSGLCLWEDDRRLGPNCSEHVAVRAMGEGHYSLAGRTILFSSSDRSDVRFNGRAYRLRPEQADPDFDEVVIKPEAITSEIGRCYIAHLGLGDGSGRFSLWENDTRLGPGACLHDEIRTQGNGTYCVWGADLYFSASDNSDPRINERTYLLRRGRKSAESEGKSDVWAGAPLERALQYMLRSAVPREDFVPGRIIHVIGSLGPGGAERQALYTLTGLGREPFESVQLLCYYLSASDNNFYLPAFSTAGIPVRTIRREVGDGDPGNMPLSVRKIREALPKGFGPDIADLFWEFVNLRPEIVHAWLDGNNVRAGLAAALAGVPRIILSGRNLNPTHLDYLYEPCMQPSYKALLELPHVKMVNNSYAGRDDYAQWLGIGADQIAVIHNGCEYPTVSSEQLSRKVRQAYGIPSDAIVVGTVARLSEEKRPFLFVEMAHRALKRLPNLKFIFFGSGPLLNEIQALIERLGISRSVKLMGVTNDIWSSLAAMDLFVSTSRVEGLPNVLIEAQCAGIPVVSTNAGGSPETFLNGKTGLRIDTATPKALAEALLELALDPDRRLTMSVAGSTFARKEFGVPKMIAQTIELYGRL